MEAKSSILITDAAVFDGKSEKLTEGMSVLIEENKITKIAKSVEAPEGAMVIDADGRTLMPGLIDAHLHLHWNFTLAEQFTLPREYLDAVTLKEAEATLMRGYTTVRDTSGPVIGIKRAIEEGLYPGPRIYSSCSALSMTAGHGDWRSNWIVPRPLGGPIWTEVDFSELGIIADGVPEVIAASRLQFRKGAHFLKMLSSGAVYGLYDPLDIGEYSFDEIKAAADEAKRWNTYLSVHTYNDAATQRSLEAGAMSIEHATITTEPTMKLLVEKGAYLCTQTGIYLQDPPADWSEDQKAKQREAKEGLDRLMGLAKKHKAKIATGTDIIGPAEVKAAQKYELTNRLKWFTPFEILNQALVNNAELLSWAGPRDPYPGKLGVIEEGAFADILLINGDPLKDLSILNKPEENLALIMKDGRIYKNTAQ